MMLNYFGFDKLHGFIMHSIMLAVGRIMFTLSNFQKLAAMGQ